MRRALLRYNHILCADDHYTSWQQVISSCSINFMISKIGGEILSFGEPLFCLQFLWLTLWTFSG